MELRYGLLDDMVPGSPHVLHRGFVNFATGRDPRFIVGRPYLP